MRSVLLILSLLPGAAIAEDWPQLLGPDRNGVYRGTAITTEWPDGKPPLLWKKDIGEGFAGPVVVGARLILFHRLDNMEAVQSLDTGDGSVSWTYEYPTSYRDDFGFDEGPRAAPTVSEKTVYTFGAQGVLSALELETGEKLWSIDTHERFRVRKGFFGAAGSPLAMDGRVLLNVGGRDAGIVAFDAETGELIWTATGDEASYSSPTAARFGDERLALFYTRSGLVVLDPASGDVRYERRWRSRSRASVNAAVPLVIGDIVFLSASYGTGALALRLTEVGLEELWSSDDALSNHYATSVHRDGALYGFHGRQEYTPSFRAVEIETGRVLWSEDAFGGGTVTLAGDKLLIVHETGELRVARAVAGGWDLLARAPLLPGVVRAYPALAEGRLYVRNETSLAAFDLGEQRQRRR